MLKIIGQHTSSGTITVPGSKNAALPLLGASIFVDHVTLENMPDVSDIHIYINILKSIGSKAQFENGTLTLDNTNLSLENIDVGDVSKMRAAYYLIPGLLFRFGHAKIPYPGGCSIGKRPLDGTINGLIDLGYKNFSTDIDLEFTQSEETRDITTNAYFSVGATINQILASVGRKGKTTVQLTAFEPHVFSLIDFLRSAGVDIAIKYDHSIIINGGRSLVDTVSFRNIGDYIVSGTFAIIGALTAEKYIDIVDARIQDLTAFLAKLTEAGVRTETIEKDTLRVYKADKILPIKLQTNIYPGFPTDLQSPFAILMTQAEGTSRIQEIMFEGRLNWLVEIENMNGQYALLNPHEVMIFGKRDLEGATVNSWDLRSGAAMVIAGLIAEGTTKVGNINYIERGYENLVGKLTDLGLKISKI